MLDPEPPISCELVLPILDSIIEQEYCVLKHLQFPYKFRKDRSTDSVFHAFILRYNEMREIRDTVTCLCCDLDLPENGTGWVHTRIMSYYGLHNATCYQCTKHYCYNCLEEDDEENCLRYCVGCERDYCRDCVKIDVCVSCDDFFCDYCTKVKCNVCNDTICNGCIGYGKAYGCPYCL